MSRHLVAGLNPALEVWVGWDRPLRTFFGQVYDPAKAEDENPIYWVGAARFGELPRIADLAEAMREYAALSTKAIAALADDEKGAPG